MSELALRLIRKAKEKRLTSLDLGNCGLTELPDELFELTWLETLILSNEHWFWNDERKLWSQQKVLTIMCLIDFSYRPKSKILI